MCDRCELCLGSRVDVDRAADDHRGDRNATNQARHDIAKSLSNQFTTGRRNTLLAIDFVDGFQI